MHSLVGPPFEQKKNFALLGVVCSGSPGTFVLGGIDKAREILINVIRAPV